MFEFISHLFRQNAPAPSFGEVPRPDAPFTAIGDIHGRADLLEQLIPKLPADHRLVFVGDYIDRGPDSAEVLTLIEELAATRNVTCLRGNHEQMCLDFLESPNNRTKLWLKHGGLQTLSSYGINVDLEAEPDLEALAAALSEALGTTRIDWLKSLRPIWHSGDVAVVHAAADPALPMAEQSDKSLLWGHPAFRSEPRTDGIWVVYGHTIVPEAYVEDGRIAIDTSAYLSGKLSAVTLDGARLFFTHT